MELEPRDDRRILASQAHGLFLSCLENYDGTEKIDCVLEVLYLGGIRRGTPQNGKVPIRVKLPITIFSGRDTSGVKAGRFIASRKI